MVETEQRGFRVAGGGFFWGVCVWGMVLRVRQRVPKSRSNVDVTVLRNLI